jgi:hypothetical protein
MIRPLVELTQLADAERRDGVPRPQDGVPVRMLAPEGLVMQLEHEVVWRILDHADLLEDDASFELQVFGTEQWPEDQVGDHVSSVLEVLVEHAGLIRRVLAGRVGIEGAAQTFEGERDVLGAACRGALEHHVLEQMRHAHALARLVHRGRPDPGSEGD